jgi:hypothetical protein
LVHLIRDGEKRRDPINANIMHQDKSDLREAAFKCLIELIYKFKNQILIY